MFSSIGNLLVQRVRNISVRLVRGRRKLFPDPGASPGS
jgi:hypothetical protein